MEALLQENELQNQEVDTGNFKYQILYKEDKIILKTYDKEYKTWVTLEFPLKGDKNINNIVTNMLTDTYIEGNIKS